MNFNTCVKYQIWIHKNNQELENQVEFGAIKWKKSNGYQNERFDRNSS